MNIYNPVHDRFISNLDRIIREHNDIEQTISILRDDVCKQLYSTSVIIHDIYNATQVYLKNDAQQDIK